jgi:DNA-binding transcriptional MerR regulator
MHSMKKKPQPKQKKSKDLMLLHETLRRSADLKKRIYTIPELMRITGISLQKVRHWNKENLLVPSWTASDAQGSQPKSYYSTQDVIKALMILEMWDRGLSLIQVKMVEENLGGQGLRLDESVKYLLTNGETACYASSPSEAVDILKDNKQMWLIPIYECAQALNRKLKSKKAV